MIRRPPRSTRTDTLFPYTTLFRSFQRIAGQALVGAALPDKALQIRVARRPLRRHDCPGGLRQLAPGLRHGAAVLLQQVLAVIEQTGIDEPGCRNQRSEERRVGTEGGSTCRSRGSP